MKNLSYILFGLSNTTAFISKKAMSIFLSAYSNHIVLVYKAMETMITIIGYVKMMNVDQLYLMNYGFINMLCILSKNTKFASVR